MENITVYPDGRLIWQEKEYRCAIGRSGITTKPKEGDGASPVGCFSLRQVFYRADRMAKPETVLKTQVLEENDGWSDDPKDEQYNQHVKHPHTFSAEKLYREDNIYDIIVVPGYNDDPIVIGRGSAIFFHIARENYSPTEGCIAVSQQDMLEILKTIKEDTQICIKKLNKNF